MILSRRTVSRARQAPPTVSSLKTGLPVRRSLADIRSSIYVGIAMIFQKEQSHDGRWQRASLTRRSPPGELSGSEFHFDHVNNDKKKKKKYEDEERCK